MVAVTAFVDAGSVRFAKTGSERVTARAGYTICSSSDSSDSSDSPPLPR